MRYAAIPLVLFGLLAGLAAQPPRRPLSRQELLQAIGQALDRIGQSGQMAQLRADRHLHAPVLVTPGDAGLKVVGIETDALHQATRFRFVATSDPRLLPFEVLAPIVVLPPGQSVALGPTAPYGPAQVSLRPVPAPRPVFLVQPGRPATLVLSGPRTLVKFSVLPMELGQRGQVIRVRDRAARRVLRARVTGRDLLAASY